MTKAEKRKLDELTEEVESLRRWKDEALWVMARWDDVSRLMRENQKVFRCAMGDSVFTQVERLLRHQIDDAKARSMVIPLTLRDLTDISARLPNPHGNERVYRVPLRTELSRTFYHPQITVDTPTIAYAELTAVLSRYCGVVWEMKNPPPLLL